MQLFARITKVDEATGKVYGRAVQEVVDRSGEIFDYETSKPNFVKWSEAAAIATDGKSVGNLRAMHGKVAAGKLTEIDFVDAEKAIDIVAEVVDPVEREKCVKGVYTGFSIGGRYAGPKWEDAVHKGVQRYTAEPSEISLVDLPCVPTAQFTVVKADGSEELRKFEATTDSLEAMQKWAESLDEDAQAVLRKLFSESSDVASTVALEKRWNAIAEIVQSVEKIAKRADVNSEKARKMRTEMAECLAKNATSEALAKSICVILGYEPTLEKGLWTVSSFAEVLDQLSCITDSAECEASWEGDNSPVPAQLRAALKPLADAFLAMAREEVTEAIKPATAVIEVIELADKGELAKAMGFDDHNEALKKWQSLSMELEKAQGELTKAQADLAATTADRDAAQASLTKVTTERDESLSKLTKLSEQHAELLKRAEPPKGVARIVPVEKTVGIEEQPNPADDEPVKKADGSIDHMATAEKQMRKVYAR